MQNLSVAQFGPAVPLRAKSLCVAPSALGLALAVCWRGHKLGFDGRFGSLKDGTQ